MKRLFISVWTMERPTDTVRSRSLTLASVIAVHAAVILWLVHTMVPPPPAASYFSLLLLPSARPAVTPPAASNGQYSRKYTHRQEASKSATEDVSPNASASVRQRALIDWAEELRRVARAATSQGAESNATWSTAAPKAPASNYGTAASAHHAGDQYTNEVGEHVVWITDNCYMVSAPSLLTVPEVFARAMLLKTFCDGRSRAARGDLFSDFAAYRK